MSKHFGAAAALRAALLVTGSTYVAYAAGLLASMLIARALGPADYGRYSYLVWLSGMLVMFMNNGLTTTSIRFVSESLGRSDTPATHALHQWFWLRQWWSIGVVTIPFGLLLPYLRPVGWEVSLWVIWAVIACASIPKAWYLFGISIAKGHGLFGVEAKSMTVISLVTAGSVIALLFAGADLSAFIALFVISSLAHPALLSRMRDTVKRVPTDQPLSIELLARVKSHFYWTALLAFVSVFYGSSMSMPFLNRFAGADAVGYFSVAAALTRGGVELLSSGLNSVLMPLMAHGYGSGGRERTLQITSDAVRLFHCFGLLLAGIGLFWAQPIVLLMYGPKFADAALAFQVLVAMGGLTLPNGVLATLLSTTDKQWLRFGVTATSVALFALSAWLLIPTHGLHGALLAYALGAFAVYLGWIWVAARHEGLVMPGRPLFRLTLAALGAGLLASSLLAYSTKLWVQFGAGCLFIALYVCATFWLRAWTANDLALIKNQTARFGKLGRFVGGLDRWAARSADR